MPLNTLFGQRVPSTGTTWIDVILAIVVGAFGLAITVVPTLLIMRRSRANEAHNTRVTDTLGESNGQGTVVQMLEQLTARAETTDARVTTIDGRVSRLERSGWRHRVAGLLVPTDTSEGHP